MTMHTLPTLDPNAVAFFAKHAGTSYNPETETPEEGALRGARRLARAEAWLKADDDLSIDWTDDWEVGSHAEEYGEAYSDGEPETCEQATLTNSNVDVLASLGCIDDASDEYRRVVEAELALGAMPSELVCDCETPDTAECGTCHSTWCAKCHPSPSYRCHWEAEHDDDDDDLTEVGFPVDVADAIASLWDDRASWLKATTDGYVSEYARGQLETLARLSDLDGLDDDDRIEACRQFVAERCAK